MEHFYVETNERTEWFATKQAALLFIELHITNQVRGNNREQLVKTNAIADPYEMTRELALEIARNLAKASAALLMARAMTPAADGHYSQIQDVHATTYRAYQELCLAYNFDWRAL